MIDEDFEIPDIREIGMINDIDILDDTNYTRVIKGLSRRFDIMNTQVEILSNGANIMTLYTYIKEEEYAAIASNIKILRGKDFYDSQILKLHQIRKKLNTKLYNSQEYLLVYQKPNN